MKLVQRRLDRGFDAVAFYAAASAGGTRPDTALFEANDGRVLVMVGAAVRASARGESVEMKALSVNGEALLSGLSDAHGRPNFPHICREYPAPASNDPHIRLRAPAPLHALRALLEAAGTATDPFAAILFGISGFDQAGFGEELPELPPHPLGVPDFLYWVPEALVVVEPGGAARLLCPVFGDDPALAHDAARRLEALLPLTEAAALSAPPPANPGEPEVDLDDDAFRAVVLRAKEHIAAGDVYQIVPSRTFTAPCPKPFDAYRRLRSVEPVSYRFFIAAPGWTLFGASPETSVRLTPDGDGGAIVEVKPIAGTRPRGATIDEDDRLEAEMRLDAKELAEHMMLVDLARNDVARVSAPGTRRVAKLLTVERFARVMHLVSSVTGRLASGLDAFDALAACLNVGTLTGAPKIRAMQLLRTLEATRRGPYGGAVGWVNAAGAMDTAVVIRSAVVADGLARVRAGAGVVHDSDPQAEADETRRKAAALLGVLA